MHGHDGRLSAAFAAFGGRISFGWRFCGPADPPAKNAVERLHGYVGSVRAGPHVLDRAQLRASLTRGFALNARIDGAASCPAPRRRDPTAGSQVWTAQRSRTAQTLPESHADFSEQPARLNRQLVRQNLVDYFAANSRFPHHPRKPSAFVSRFLPKRACPPVSSARPKRRCQQPCGMARRIPR